MLIRAVIFLGTAALGLLVAAAVVPGVRLSVSGFLIAVAVFALAQSILAPFIFNVARKYAPAMLGGIGLVSTFVALLIATWFPEGLRISGVSSWISATLVVWIVTALGAWLLPLVLLKKRVGGRTASTP
ncbi:phage holin family protein [Ornithinibacter aureus]|uniref:Phage holin family protein n=1 Tax=Ornithinibacter aureus TaxID=622664 RepID=A0ABP8JMS3_9MICO|nr:phage holin family protein [Ornithinibacter aureus]